MIAESRVCCDCNASSDRLSDSTDWIVGGDAKFKLITVNYIAICASSALNLDMCVYPLRVCNGIAHVAHVKSRAKNVRRVLSTESLKILDCVNQCVANATSKAPALDQVLDLRRGDREYTQRDVKSSNVDSKFEK